MICEILGSYSLVSGVTRHLSYDVVSLDEGFSPLRRIVCHIPQVRVSY